jgi:thioredoxin-dependent peroxiredoxin
MTHLKEGDKINLNHITSNTDLKGKKLILYFYPKDNTPGCTAEACNLKDNYGKLKDANFEVIGVSPDNEKSHQKFTEKFNLPFKLIADTEKTISNEFGVWGEKKMYGKTYEGINRTTFIINDKGIIEKIFDKVDTKEHYEQIIKAL